MKRCRSFLCFLTLAMLSQGVAANPQGGVVSAGQVQISSPNSNTTNIYQSSNKAIINWQTFNIQRGQTTHFFQPSSSSITLNRINGLNGPSSIFGNLLANGQVWLINPSGIMFGKGAQVNVGGLLATTSQINDNDFLSGNYKFTSSTSLAHGAIVNNGHIQVQPGGLVALIGNSVDNRGVIQAKVGTVILGSAQAYTLDFDGDQLINFTIQQGPTKTLKNTVTNTGIIDTGMRAYIRPTAARHLIEHTINTSHYRQANHVSSKGGVIILDAGGGNVRVSGKLLARNGKVEVRGRNINVQNARIKTGGGLTGGDIKLLSTAQLTLNNAHINANGINNGGTVSLFGKNIDITNTQIQANGNTSGGKVLVGGDARGVGPDPSASSVSVDNNSTISANALTNGAGGSIVIWSNGSTQVAGTLSATGGLSGGNGGYIETSGELLNINGIQISTKAPKGLMGDWLLDPSDVTISTGTDSMVASGTGPYTDTPATGASTSILNTTTLATQLNSSNVTVVTTSTGSGPSGGSITIASPLTWTSNSTLTLTATTAIKVNAAITASAGNGSLVFNAPSGITLAAAVNTGTGSQTYNGPVTLGGNVTITMGTLSMPNSLSLPTGNTLTLANSNATTLANGISGAGILALSGTGVVTLNTSNSYSGGTTVATNASLSVTNIGALGTGPISVNHGTITFNLGGQTLSNTNTITLISANLTDNAAANQSDTLNNAIVLASSTSTFISSTTNSTLILNGVISGAGGMLISSGPHGTIDVFNNNTFSGGLTINGHELYTTNPGGLGTGTILLEGGYILGLNLGGQTLTNTSTINIHNGSIILDTVAAGKTDTITNPITLTNVDIVEAQNANATLLFTGTMTNGSAAGGFSVGSATENGNGIVQVTNTGTYTQSTRVFGTLYVTNPNAASTTAAWNLQNSASKLIFNLGGQQLVSTANINMPSGSTLIDSAAAGQTDTLANNVVLSGSNTIQSSNANSTLALTGVISGSGGWSKAGSGTLNLSNTNSYTGLINIVGGSLTLGIANALSSGTDVVLANTAGAVLNLNDFSDTIGSLAGGGSSGGNVTLGTGTLSTGADDSSTTYSGAISGSGGLTKLGIGTMTLGDSANTYTGQTSINNGTLSVVTLANGGTNSSLGATAASTPILLNSATGAKLLYTGAQVSTNRTITISGAGGGTIESSAQTLTLAGAISNGGNLLTLVTNTSNITVSGVISGSGGLTQTGSSAGILRLSGANTFTGATVVNAGSLYLLNVNALGSGALQSSSTSIASGATLFVDFNGTLGNTNTINISGTGVAGAGAIWGGGGGVTETLTNPIVMQANSTLLATDNTFLNGNISDGGNNYTLTLTGNGGTGAQGGTIKLGGNNSYGGGTIINSGSTYVMNSNALGTNGAISVASGATLRLNFPSADVLANANTISLSGTGEFGAGALAIQGNTAATLNNPIVMNGNTSFGGGGNITLNGVISDGGNNYSLSLIKTATYTFSAANTYTGATTVFGGTLNLANANALGSGATQSSSITVASGATLTTDFATGTLGNNTATITLNGTGVGNNGALQSAINTDTLSNNIILGSDTTMGGAGSLVLNGTINGASALTAQGLNALTLNGAVGNTNALTSLSATASTLSVAQVTTTGAQSYTGSTSTTLNGTYRTSGATFGVTGPALLGGAVLIDTTNSGAAPAGANISFSSTVDNAQSLTVASGNGTISFNGVLGGINPLTSLTATSTGATNDITITNNVNTSGAINITAGGNITLSDGNLSSSTGNVTLAGTAGLVQETGSGLINGVLLTTHSIGGTNLNNANTVTSFNGTNSSSGTIALTNTAAPLTITGISQSGGGEVTITNTGALTTSGAITTTTNGNISLTATGDTETIGAPVTANGSGTVTLSATGANSDIIYNAPVSSTTGAILATAEHNEIIGSTTTLSGGPITLVAGNAFINNNPSPTALSPSAGNNYLVYSANPANDTRGNLSYDFKQYNATYNTTSILGTGNGLLYRIAPIITPALTGTVFKIYNANTTATLASENYSNTGAIDGDSVTLNNPVSGTYATANAGSNINVSVSGIAIANASNGTVAVYGYTLGSPTANANIGIIAPAPLTINPTSGQSKVYGTNDSSNGFTYTTSINLFANDSITGNLGRASGENVGVYAYNLGNLTAGANYTISLTRGTFAITPAPLTAVIANQNKTYGTNDPSIGSIATSLNGVVNTTVKTWDSNGQYISAPPINDTANITSTLVSLVRVSGESVANSPYNITAATFTPLSGSAASNYTGPTYISGASTLTIAPAHLTLTANNATKSFGNPDPLFTDSETGLITNTIVTNWMNETTPINDSLYGSLSRLPGNAPGEYPIIQGTLSAGSNYQVTYNGAFLTINPPSDPPIDPPSPTQLINSLSSLAVIINGTVPEPYSQKIKFCNDMKNQCKIVDLYQVGYSKKINQTGLNGTTLNLNKKTSTLSVKSVNGTIHLFTPLQ